MTQRSAFQVQVLEKIGAPLVAAVRDVSGRGDEGAQGSVEKDAERVAELLSKSVKLSVDLAGSMDLKDADGQADSVRLALAAVGSTLVSGLYRSSGKVPGDNDLQRLVRAMEATLTFSDNFAPAPENTARLENIEPGAVLADESQVGVQYLAVLAPVVSAAASFSFGRPENKLVQDVAGRLVKRAEEIATKAMDGAGGDQGKRGALYVLKALSGIYVECHEAEKVRLMAMNEAERQKESEQAGGTLPMDAVWKSFDMRAGMMLALADGVVPGGSAAVASAAPSVPVKGPVDSAAPPSAGVSQEAPELAQQAQPSEPDGGASPFSGFAKKEEAGAAPPPAAPADESPSPPVEEVSAQEDAGEQEAGSGDDGNYNPMGFFTPGGKDEDKKEGGEA